MAMIEINRNPSRRELRQFAGIWLPALLFVVSGLIWYHTGSPLIAAAVFLPALAASLAGFFAPRLIRPIFVGLTCAVFPIGWTISHLVLAVTYYLVMTPIGLLMRLSGHDPLQRKPDRCAETYWTARSETQDQTRYFRQF